MAIPVFDYHSVDFITKRKLQALMWLALYGRYDSTTPYTKEAERSDELTAIPKENK